MVESHPVYIISDSPAEKDEVSFGFDAYAKTLAELIAYRMNKTPMVIGVYGSWGAGKTTLMQAVIDQLSRLNKNSNELFRSCKTVWFQAWKYGKEDEILSALIEVILKTMHADGFFQSCKATVEELIVRFNLKELIGELTSKIAKVDVTKFFDDLPHKKRLGFYDSFQNFFKRLIWNYLMWDPQACLDDEPDDTKAALVVFIDDLDRCPKDRISEVLETIKLFMDTKGCIFVIGAANEIIENALQKKYGPDDAGKFMDKIVQVTFNLPQILEADFASFLDKKALPNKKDLEDHIPLVLAAIKNNPRRLKRFLNNLSLLHGILLNKQIEIDFKNLLFWSIIDYLSPRLREDLKDRPEILLEIKKSIQELEAKLDSAAVWEIPSDAREQIPASFQIYLKDREIVDVLKAFDADPEHIRQLAALTGIVQSAEDAKEKLESADEEQPDFEAMAEIPAGPFIYQGGEGRIESPYFIDIYPVTNRQYEKFLRAGGYRTDDYWSPEGLKWRNQKRITQPEYWNDRKWNRPEHPVEGVSFYEAEAYAEWSGKRLPTEPEWERAARWTDGRSYPWGNEFDKDKCNTKESGIGATSRVTRYPDGRTPDGCYDMAGNVWEWTSSREKGVVLLRGGSWYDTQGLARCAYRYRFFPYERIFYIGFRCVRTKNK